MVSATVREKTFKAISSAVPMLWVRRRSYTSLLTSISVRSRPFSKRFSASSVPFSAMIWCAPNTRSAVDSPSPASAYT